MQLAGILAWWLLISLFGLAALPINLVIFRFLPDRGYAFTKATGLLLLGILAWLVGFIHFSVGTIALCFALLAGLAYWVWKKHETELLSTLKNLRGYILVVELFFLALLLLFLAFRMYNPDILGTEKFMDLAFMNSISRSASFPPFDPWLAGPHWTISYYYFGYLLMGIMTKVSLVPPAVAFNLALGLLFALSGVGVFGLLYNLTRSLLAAVGGWAAVFLLGNLDGLRQVLTTGSIDNFNWWTPSRVIPDTINEFPFFSFLLGDMHPHMLSVPFFVLSLALALNHLKSPQQDVSPRTGERLAEYLLWGLVIGALGFLNSWDMPTSFFIAALAMFFQQFKQQPLLARIPWKGLLAGLGIMLACMLVPYLPFYLNFHSQAKGLALTAQNTRVGDYLLLFGFFMFLALTFVVVRYHAWFLALLAPAQAKNAARKKSGAACPECGRPVREGKRFCGHCGAALVEGRGTEGADSPLVRPVGEVPAPVRQFWLFLLQPAALLRRGEGRPAAIFGFCALLLVTAAFWKSPFLALMVFLLLALLPLLFTRAESEETQFAWLLLFTAWLLTFGAEVLHINDTFQPPLDRMNTVFKFYYQVWYLLGIAGVYGAVWTLRHSLRNRNLRAAWQVLAVLLIGGSLVYPYAALLIKTNHFQNEATLDGSDYLTRAYPADRAGIEWLRRHARGNPVVLEATGGEYTDFARVSSFTGLPTVLGWAGHELQWRGNYDEPAKRIPDIDTLYTSQDLEQVKTLLDRYSVEYVFVGSLERQKYPAPGLQKFARILRVAYENPGAIIYQRR